jgi:hypothetical protein
MTPEETEALRDGLGEIERIAQERATESWARLPDTSRGQLTARQIDEFVWSQSFGVQLGRFLRTGIHGPDTLREAVLRAQAIGELAVDDLAIRHVGTILAGQDPVLNGAATFRLTDGLLGASTTSGPFTPPEQRSSRRIGRPMETPFDRIVDRIWNDDNDRVTIGPFRLAGALELVAGAVMLALVWVPGTLAVTYRLLHGDIRWGNLAKGTVGWVGVAMAVTWLISMR